MAVRSPSVVPTNTAAVKARATPKWQHGKPWSLLPVSWAGGIYCEKVRDRATPSGWNVFL